MVFRFNVKLQPDKNSQNCTSLIFGIHLYTFFNIKNPGWKTNPGYANFTEPQL